MAELKDHERAHNGTPGSKVAHGGPSKLSEATHVELVKTHGPSSPAVQDRLDETAHKQTWRIHDDKGGSKDFTLNAGLEGVETHRAKKKYVVGGHEYAAHEIIHHAVSSGLPAEDGEKASAKDVIDPDVTGR